MVKSLNTMAMSKFFSAKPTRSRFTTSISLSVTTKNGVSIRSTRQFTVGSTKLEVLYGTPGKASSRNGISNSSS